MPLTVHDLVAERSERYLEWLCEACAIPSLAEDPAGLEQMSSWLECHLSELGATTERLSCGTAPDYLLARIGEGARSLLVYDHYDVQPAEPLDLWASKPFSPEVRDGVVYARGVADNKGDLVARLAGLELYQQVHGDIPLEIKFLVEGEEEVGSRNFDAFVSRYGHKLEADGCIWEGAGI
ncbi:MAG: M20/M25/M40 family metallo-hydrolase, partial [Actinomycetota bacterium]